MLDTIIIGAGFSGIAAGKLLHEHGRTFKILEARDRIGGRVHTKRFSEELYVDLGGQWIGPGQDRMYQLCEELAVPYFETYNTGYHMLDFGGKVKKFKGLIPKLDPVSLVNIDFVLKKLEKMAKQINVDQPWSHPKAAHYDSVSLAFFLEKNCRTQNCKKIVQLALETVFACELNEISLLHALFYIKSGRDLNTLINIENGAQQHRIVGGMQTLIGRMAEPFREEILFEHPVYAVEQKEGFVHVSGQGFDFPAKTAIIAIPPPLAANIDFNPPLPLEKRQLLDRIAMGIVVKCFMIYEKPFWRKEDFSGQAFADGNSPFQSIFDSSPKDGSYGIILGFCISDRAKAFLQKEKTKRQLTMQQMLVRYFGEKANNPIQYIDHTMSDEAWTKGCYAGLYPTGAWTGFKDAYRKQQGNIFWAGTESSEKWYGYIEGAVLAGEKAAKMVLEWGKG
jgi:monoamine oxidase